ncbi:MAG: riboflavin synthase [Calditrichia bacterium]|nr:riboflavin synthase [Calditrichia bacterium]
MFTGIIEEIGTVDSIKAKANGFDIRFLAGTILKKIRNGDSVAIDGACQTITQIGKDSFHVQAVGETLTKSTLGGFKKGRRINLESSLTLNTPLGGHLVQGHVQGTAKILQWMRRGDNYYLEIDIPDPLKKYCIAEGSIAIDGISLTIAHLSDRTVGISIIPYTVEHTTLHTKRVGDSVNIETDIIARYIERYMFHSKEDGINLEKLRTWGY